MEKKVIISRQRAQRSVVAIGVGGGRECVGERYRKRKGRKREREKWRKREREILGEACEHK